MRVAEIIRTAREGLGLTQEDLAEKMDVSRQAVSKWELGASLPTAENLDRLSELLGVEFPPEEDGAPPEADRPSSSVPWKAIALALGALLVLAVMVLGLLLTKPFGGKEPVGDLGTGHEPQDTPEDLGEPVQQILAEGILPQNVLRDLGAAPSPQDTSIPAITGLYFFQEDGTPMEPDLGDGWCSLPVGQRVLLLVIFRQGSETGVGGVSLFATPTGTETYDDRQQLAVQAVYDRLFALFSLEFPEETMIHLDVTLECDLGQNIAETLNVTTLPPPL